MRGVNQPKRERAEKQRAKRQAKEERRASKPKKRLTPEERQAQDLAIEIARCDAILGHPSTRQERDEIRQREVRELVAFIEDGWAKAARLAAERAAGKAAKGGADAA